MEYKNYLIESFRGHYKVTNLEDPSDTWEEDTVQDAKETIDES